MCSQVHIFLVRCVDVQDIIRIIIKLWLIIIAVVIHGFRLLGFHLLILSVQDVLV